MHSLSLVVEFLLRHAQMEGLSENELLRHVGPDSAVNVRRTGRQILQRQRNLRSPVKL